MESGGGRGSGGAGRDHSGWNMRSEEHTGEMNLKGGWGSDHMARDVREVAEAPVLWMMVPFTERRHSGRLVGGTA